MKPPSLREVTSLLRSANAAFDGPGFITLSIGPRGGIGLVNHDERKRYAHTCALSEHSEEIPGDGRKFDPVAIARRLIAGLP